MSQIVSAKEKKSLLRKKNSFCNACSSPIKELISLPSLPFTGIYLSSEETAEFPFSEGVDQGFSFCESCFHGELTSVIDPNFVYDRTYTHRGSKSAIAKGGNEFFVRFVEKLFPGKKFETIFDIGCNDGFLLRQLEYKGKSLFGVDPIWEEKNIALTEKINLLGGFVEDLDIEQVLGRSPDLVVSAHTFEHIENPKAVLESLVQKVDIGTYFVIEVPSLDTLVRNNRFDQIFHQHIQYFSSNSILTLMEILGCFYVAHTFNYSMWGGTMLFAFVKGKKESVTPLFSSFKAEEILSSYDLFKASLKNLSNKICSLKKESICAFGAAQMLPILAYHMPCHFQDITQIYDDNKERHFLKYPGFDFTVQNPDKVSFEDKTVVVTALDSSRPIVNRLNLAGAKSILLPLQSL